ncbi:MAG TPA: glycoside hydrolase family 99-like domain-containing protein, partial [Pyrinomonadaceae bacterium]|nr:glycoside hydrolase family 99-like domain-containing protein [Pyrinomonadaceae bacterium]
ENDLAWGKGFTEWRNTQRGVPRFVGHQQPRVPRDLGFYDLTNPQVLRQQVDLARASGVHGFCFYYYHFDGKRVLEKPLEQFLGDRTLDFPFSIIWANENWTRRWDGMDDDVILWQHYSDEYEDILLADWSRHFSDPRYIRAEGRPLFIIYRPGIIPDAREKIARWRRRLKDEFAHEPWMLMVQGFGDLDPQTYGFDGAIEFPPHKLTRDVPRLNSQVAAYDPSRIGEVIAYTAVVEQSLGEPQADFPLIKTLTPSWDNDCRRPGRGLVMQGSTPKIYQRWLEELVWRAAIRPFAGEPFVFVNAWNEWAEAAYLEPDVYSGSAYLNATARAIVGEQAATEKPEIVLVGHDAHPHGAQLLLLHLGQLMAKRFGLRVTFLLLDGGLLVEQYRATGKVIVASASSAEMQSAIEEFQRRGAHLAITNTLVTGLVVPALRRRGFRVVSLVHELPRLARERFLEAEANAIAAYSDYVVCAADIVGAEFAKFTGMPRATIKIVPQGHYLAVESGPSDRAAVRAELGLPNDSLIVLGVAYADLRKGIDLFLSTARAAASCGRTNIYYVWVGNAEPAVETWLLQECNLGHLPNFRRVDRTNNLGRYYGAADALFL